MFGGLFGLTSRVAFQNYLSGEGEAGLIGLEGLAQ